MIDEILKLISVGMPIYKIAQLRHMPDREQILAILHESENQTKYREAQARAADAVLDEMDQCVDRMLIENVRDTRRISDKQARVALQALQWKASKLNPGMYGNRTSVDLTSNGETIQQGMNAFYATLDDE